MKFSYEMFLYNSFDIKHEIFSCGVLMKIIIPTGWKHIYCKKTHLSLFMYIHNIFSALRNAKNSCLCTFYSAVV